MKVTYGTRCRLFHPDTLKFGQGVTIPSYKCDKQLYFFLFSMATMSEVLSGFEPKTAVPAALGLNPWNSFASYLGISELGSGF